MNAAAVLAFIQAAGTVLAAATTVIEDSIAISGLIKGVIDKGEPTQDDWDALAVYQAKNDAIINAKMGGEE
jgi:hypothetical protein